MVYKPKEDTFLLADVATDRISCGNVLEVGSGTGYISKRISSIENVSVYAVDVNNLACKKTYEKIGGNTVQGNLASSFQQETFDWVVFNPPYLPNENKLDDCEIKSALVSNNNGTSVISDLFDDIQRVLRANGKLLLLYSSKTGEDELNEIFSNANSQTKIRSRKLFFEEISVSEFSF